MQLTAGACLPLADAYLLTGPGAVSWRWCRESTIGSWWHLITSHALVQEAMEAFKDMVSLAREGAYTDFVTDLTLVWLLKNNARDCRPGNILNILTVSHLLCPVTGGSLFSACIPVRTSRRPHTSKPLTMYNAACTWRACCRQSFSLADPVW